MVVPPPEVAEGAAIAVGAAVAGAGVAGATVVAAVAAAPVSGASGVASAFVPAPSTVDPAGPAVAAGAGTWAGVGSADCSAADAALGA